MRLIATGLTILILLAITGFGLVYTFSPSMLPYHQAALGADPATLTPNNIALYFAVLHACGMMALTTAALAAFIFAYRDRIGDRLAIGFLLVVAGFGVLGQALNAYYLHSLTGANTPWLAVLGLGAVASVAGVLWFTTPRKT